MHLSPQGKVLRIAALAASSALAPETTVRSLSFPFVCAGAYFSVSSKNKSYRYIAIVEG